MRISQACLLPLGLCLGALTASAQEVVHAVAGTVTSVDPKAKTLSVVTDDGSEGTFNAVVKPGVVVEIPKALRNGVTPAASYNHTKSRVLVFYIGDDSIRTAVGLEDLGAGPFVKSTGTIVNFDRHAHVLTIKNASGADESFHLDNKTLAEAAEGVQEAARFDGHKGDRVRVTATTNNGAETALFIRSM
jgi:hypothetical protein